MRRGGLVGAALEKIEEVTGVTVVDRDYLRVQEAIARESSYLAGELEEIGYVAMDYMSGRPNQATANTRRRWAQQARIVWQSDPQAGAAVELLNEFTFGRGVPRPTAKDEKVQEVIDDFWDDPDNQAVLTSYIAQIRFGNSLSIQSNVFFLMFDDGDDGKVKLSYLNHDTVNGLMEDPDNRQRVLYYLAYKQQQEWDYNTDSMKVSPNPPKLLYYPHWRNVEIAKEEKGREVPFKEPPEKKRGEGKVYHVAENLDMEMVFGHPRMRRTIRWYTAYNEFMAARVDMMAAAASFIMRRTVKGTGTTLEKMATKAMRANSDLLAAATPEGDRLQGPTPASIMQELGDVTHEPFKLDSGAGNAAQDGQMLRAQVSAGDRFPQHYLGDVGSANLATATSMELPVLKHVEARQELIEQVFRWSIDRVIERAVEVGKLTKEIAEDEREPAAELRGVEEQRALPAPGQTVVAEADMLWRINGRDAYRRTRIVKNEQGEEFHLLLREAHEDQADDERETERDLSYEFAMPSPLRRAMPELVQAVATTCQTFDPNNTNPELSRTMLVYILSQAFEIPNAEEVVDRIFPPGYVPPELAAMQQQGMGQEGTQNQPNFFGPDAAGMPPDPEAAGPYGTPRRARYAEENMKEAAADDAEPDDFFVTTGRGGQMVVWPGRRRPSAGDVPVQITARTNGRYVDLDRMFEDETRGVTMDALASLSMDRLSEKNGRG